MKTQGAYPLRVAEKQQRERIPPRKKDINKTWCVCSRWTKLRSERVFKRWFASEEQARKFLEKQERSNNVFSERAASLPRVEYWIEHAK